jgi:hypothetical protein
MGLGRRSWLWIIVVAGLAVRLFFAANWFGNGDLFTFALVGARTVDDPLHTYGGDVLYPYPPGYLPWLAAASELSRTTGESFSTLAHLLPILADVALAVAVYVYLGWRRATESMRTLGFAAVMLGPAFIAISGYHGQMDGVAILPGVLALMAWERRPQSNRAIESGILVAIGGLIKSVPMLLVLPLLSSARSVREGLKLVVSAGAVFGLVCLPFFLAEPDGYRRVLSYTGVPGRGGISVLTDPTFAAERRTDPVLATVGHPNDLTDWISQHNGLITVVVLIAVAAFLFRYRPAPIDGVVILWLAIFVFSPNFLLQYLLWALPFFLMAGYIREVVVLQIALIPPLLITYLSPDATLADIYVVIMIGLWIFWALALATVVRRVVRREVPPPPETQPPLVELRPASAAA